MSVSRYALWGALLVLTNVEIKAQSSPSDPKYLGKAVRETENELQTVREILMDKLPTIKEDPIPTKDDKDDLKDLKRRQEAVNRGIKEIENEVNKAVKTLRMEGRIDDAETLGNAFELLKLKNDFNLEIIEGLWQQISREEEEKRMEEQVTTEKPQEYERIDEMVEEKPAEQEKEKFEEKKMEEESMMMAKPESERLPNEFSPPRPLIYLNKFLASVFERKLNLMEAVKKKAREIKNKKLSFLKFLRINKTAN